MIRVKEACYKKYAYKSNVTMYMYIYVYIIIVMHINLYVSRVR